LVHCAGGNGAKFSTTVFDDSAKTSIQTGKAPFTGAFKPNSSLNVFQGLNARGTWKLVVRDYETGKTGVINGWRLIFKGYPGTPDSYVLPSSAKLLPSALATRSTTASLSTTSGPSSDKIIERASNVVLKASTSSLDAATKLVDYLMANEDRTLSSAKALVAALDPRLFDKILRSLQLESL
jgi:hypothetical protein